MARALQRAGGSSCPLRHRRKRQHTLSSQPPCSSSGGTPRRTPSMQQSLLGPAAATPSHQSLPRCWNHSRQCHRQAYLRPPAFTCRRRQPDALRAVTVETAAPGSTSQPEQQEPHSAVSVLCGQSRLTHAAQLVWAQVRRALLRNVCALPARTQPHLHCPALARAVRQAW